MLFVFCLRGSSRILDIRDRIIAYKLAELPYRVLLPSYPIRLGSNRGLSFPLSLRTYALAD